MYPGFKILFPSFTITLWLFGFALYGVFANVNILVLPSPVKSLTSNFEKLSTAEYTAKLIMLLSGGALPNDRTAFASSSVLSVLGINTDSTATPFTVA